MADAPPTFGVAVLARPTFDVPFAEAMKDCAFAALDAAGIRTVGPRTLSFDVAAVEAAIASINAAGPIDLLLVLQVTFTDAAMTVELARAVRAPIALWAVPEPRLGGRLRLNAFCGLNLAAHALGRAAIPYGWLFAHPGAPGIGEELRALPPRVARVASRARSVEADAALDEAGAARAFAALEGTRIAQIGEPPGGFVTCEYDSATLRKLAGIEIVPVALDELFDRARAAPPAAVAADRAALEPVVEGLDLVDQPQLDRSLRVLSALRAIASDRNVRGMAVRCWPETFTEYGCAACAPMGSMNEARVPATCEADVHGAISQLLLQQLAGAPAWLADLVDIDVATDTAILWHCGSAPLSMRDAESTVEATIHSNRRMPLLHQFTLKPGRITVARISRARGRIVLMLAGAEMLRAPMAFTGTSGTVRFDRHAAEVCATILDEGLEHHYALAYGEHRPALRSLASKLDLPVLDLA